MDWIPVVLFLVIGVVFCCYFFFRYRIRREMQQTVRVAIERGQELTPQALAALGGEAGSAQGDLRKGVLWLAIAAALGILGWSVEEPEVYGVAAFPLMLGIAYLLLWRLSPKVAASPARAAE